MTAWVPDQWLPWAKVVAHGVELLGSVRLAIAALEQRLCAGDISAVDYCVANGMVATIPLTTDFFRRVAERRRQLGTVRGTQFKQRNPAFAALEEQEFASDLFDHLGDHHVFLSRADVLKFWPQNKPDETALGYPVKDTRGNRAAYDWEKILIRAFTLLWEEGLPDDQNAFVDKVHMLFTGSPDWKEDRDAPGRTQMIEHLRPLFRAIKGIRE